MRYTNRSKVATNTREPNGQQIGSVPNKIRMIKKSDANRNSDSTLPHNTIKVFIIIGLSTIVIGSVVIMGKMKGKIF